jgi:phytoene synthase
MSSNVSPDLVKLSADVIKAGSKSFAAAARLFDKETRASAYLLYAWCRHCDDVIDGQELGAVGAAPTGHDAEQELAKLYALTRTALDNQPMQDPVFEAFRHVAAKHAIPSQHPIELLDGFAMDVNERCYETIDDTLTYCYHVAGVVGVMMAWIMGVRDDETLDRASDLGIGFQLTNIARDIVDDAKVGRIYLPREWLSEAGVPADELLDSAHRPALFEVARRLLELADNYYESSLVGIARLPIRSRGAVATARVVYSSIGRERLRIGPQAIDRRVVTSKSQKLMAVAIGGLAALTSPMRYAIGQGPSREGLWTRQRPQ